MVKTGDTLYRIAKAYGVSVKQIKRVNNLHNSIIYPDEIIIIPTKTGKKRTANIGDPSVETSNLTTYIVERGENLYRISLRFGISIEELKMINNLSGNIIRIGQTLLVPSDGIEEELPDILEETEEGVDMAGIAPGIQEEVRVKSAGEAVEGDRGQATGNLSDNSERNAAVFQDEEGEHLIKIAMDYLGVPYRFGGSSLRGIDCSAFVQRVFRYFSIELPRTAREQFKVGVRISKKELLIGDLLFFRTYARYPSHVGIYIGEGKMIHASSRSKKVTISSIKDPYYVRRYIGAIRLSNNSSRVSVESSPVVISN